MKKLCEVIVAVMRICDSCNSILAIFIVYPYLTIHMRELGINVEETAIMSGITPVVSILMPPIAGLIADKIGNYKVIA